MSTLPIRIRAVCRGSLPAYKTALASGLDLEMKAWRYSDTPGDFPDRECACIIRPGDRVIAKTGLSIELPDGLEAQVRPRSGLSLRSGVVAVLGTIDADYRGEVGVILSCIGDEPVEIALGERVAQLVFAPVVRVEFDVVDSLSDTARGAGGFGSTGRR